MSNLVGGEMTETGPAGKQRGSNAVWCVTAGAALLCEQSARVLGVGLYYLLVIFFNYTERCFVLSHFS